MLSTDREPRKVDVIILGAGPAGLTAGIYLGRARLRSLIVDTGTVGGQMVLSHEVANYPGVEATSGHSISLTMRRQAEQFGAEIVSQAEIVDLELKGETKRIELEDEGIFEAPVVILAAGGRPRTLGLESEARFAGQGISYCATCDGDFFTGKEIVVVGGGNSALEEAVSLTKYATKVTVLHVLDNYQAQPWAIAEAEGNQRVELYTGHEVQQFVGDGRLEGVVVKDLHKNETRTIPAQGAFVFIGYVPATEMFAGKVRLNGKGEIVTDERLQTNIPGVYAAGDAREKRYRQITTAVADGTVAAMSAIEFLAEKAREEAFEEPMILQKAI